MFASRGEARRMIAGGGVTINGDARHGPGVRPGADRRGVARRPDRQAPARDRAPRRLIAGPASAQPRGGSRSVSMTADGGRPRSASRTRAWYSRSAVSPARASRVAVAIRAGRLGRGVVLGGEQDLGRLLGDLAAGRVDAAVEQRVV